ncbi:MAG: DUF1403 family protein [Caulobacter sp.]|nr:DUF1403 family protein [Caulobacter sp.]
MPDHCALSDPLAAACFEAGRALGGLEPAATAGAAHQGVWLERLALGAAAACLRFAGRCEDEPAIRDAVLLTRPGDDPGPAGAVLLLWRRLGARSPGLVGAEELAAETGRLIRRSGPDAGLLGGLLAAGGPFPPAAAIRAASVLLEGWPREPAAGLAVADLILARRLGWPRMVPLLAAGLGRRPRPGAADWAVVCARAWATAAARARLLHEELGLRAARLVAAGGRVRARGTPEVVAGLLESDALSGAVVRERLVRGGSDRAARRILGRLAELGVIRELTGRASHRMYGL